ncbi:hypothetical protein EP7_005045 [Isosphaeraceae bacterium EP7]
MRRRLHHPMHAALGLTLLMTGCNCGHSRQVMYPAGTRDSNDDIHIRAPFVDVRVPRNNKSSRVVPQAVEVQPPLEVED